ncbi:MAG TPA: YqgE/AlgH family protein [Alphaproteobacteria bacterium]|nr:YqgE/AlgH family protein [Alphaproteobacteria bacterium]
MDATADTDSLTGQLLVAMPNMQDPRFHRAVIYVCTHGPAGAMGLVINRPFTEISFKDLMAQLGIFSPRLPESMRVHFGGPMESGRGFVLHSVDWVREGTMLINDDVAMTATIDILRAIADGNGPRKCVLVLGYVGWGPGQLETELQNNSWINVPATEGLLFDPDLGAKWESAFATIGVRPSMLSGEAGHA